MRPTVKRAMKVRSIGPLDVRDKEGIAQLRRALDDAGFNQPAAVKIVQRQRLYGWRHGAVPESVQALSGRDETPNLFRLFLLGAYLDIKDASAALAPLDLGRAESLNLVEVTGQRVRATAQLIPHEDLIVASDWNPVGTSDINEHYVGNVNPTSVALAYITVRQPCKTALDLGTGCGIQALLAARHSGHVIATDVNPRALNFAAFNAILNGISNIECRQGSMFEPVGDCRFDLIVSNPPYVVSPDRRYAFRDSGRGGDSISHDLVRQAPSYLEEGGYAHVLCNWVLREGEEWSTPVQRWVEDLGCSSLLLYYQANEPLDYAVNWNKHLQSVDPEDYGKTLEKWLNYYDRLQVRSIASGAVVLRHGGGTGWIERVELPSGPVEIGPSGDHVLRIFRGQDFLARHDDTTLLSQAFSLMKEHQIRQTLQVRRGQLEALEAQLVLEGGLRTQGRIDAYVLRLLAACDGRRTLGEIAVNLAKNSGASPEEFTQAITSVVRKLVGTGFLVPA